jgi:hypothetical protein
MQSLEPELRTCFKDFCLLIIWTFVAAIIIPPYSQPLPAGFLEPQHLYTVQLNSKRHLQKGRGFSQMKRLFLLFLTFALVLASAACQTGNADTDPAGTTETTGSTEPSETPEASEPSETTEETGTPDNILDENLENILEGIYKTADVDDAFREYIENGLMTTKITAENCKYHLGKEDSNMKRP